MWSRYNIHNSLKSYRSGSIPSTHPIAFPPDVYFDFDDDDPTNRDQSVMSPWN